MGAVPVFLCIDLEPPERLARLADPDRWRGVDAVADYLARLRPRLAEATGREVRFVWSVRCDPQIETAFGSADDLLRSRSDLLARLAAAGDRIGLHVHAWRWEDETGEWVDDFADSAWVEHCVVSSAEAYRGHFGTLPELHRFGDRFLSTGVVRVLSELGVRFDLTVEPGLPPGLGPGERSTGPAPDFARAPREPYRPSPRDVLVADPSVETGPLLVPLSSADPSAALPLTRRVGRKVRHPFRPSHRPLTLYRAWSSPQAFWDLVDRHIDTLARPYLAFAIRSDEPGGGDAERARAVLGHLPGHPVARRLRFTEPAGALGELLPAALARA